MAKKKPAKGARMPAARTARPNPAGKLRCTSFVAPATSTMRTTSRRSEPRGSSPPGSLPVWEWVCQDRNSRASRRTSRDPRASSCGRDPRARHIPRQWKPPASIRPFSTGTIRSSSPWTTSVSISMLPRSHPPRRSRSRRPHVHRAARAASDSRVGADDLLKPAGLDPPRRKRKRHRAARELGISQCPSASLVVSAHVSRTPNAPGPPSSGPDQEQGAHELRTGRPREGEEDRPAQRWKTRARARVGRARRVRRRPSRRRNGAGADRCVLPCPAPRM